MPAQAKTRAKPVATVSMVADAAPAIASPPQKSESKVVHAMLDELFIALQPYGACNSTKVVTLFHRLKSAT